MPTGEEVKEYGFAIFLFIFFLGFLTVCVRYIFNRMTALEKQQVENDKFVKSELIGLIKTNNNITVEHTKAYRENTKMFHKLCEHVGNLDK